MIRRNFIRQTALGAAFTLVPFQARNLFAIPENYAGNIKITPEVTDEILSNPGIGWVTSSQTSKTDKNLPEWIPSRICFRNWGWANLEPERGKIDTDFLDNFLKDAHDSGQTLAFRVMTSYPNRQVHPDWLKEYGKINYTNVFIDERSHDKIPVPDFDDEKTLNSHIDFVRNLGQIYDGHPDIEVIDLGSVGWWGEWHLSGQKIVKMPSVDNMKKIIDAYLEGFKKTPLVIPIGAENHKLLEYATTNGAGWRADCFGDMNWHMIKYYTQSLARDNALEAWKKKPVAWETCWDFRKWVAEKWPLRFIFNYGLVLHGSMINNKSVPFPEGDEIKEETQRFLRRLGYRFVLKELEHPSKVKAGRPVELSMKWQNTGSAPVYKPYRLAYRLTSASDSKIEYKFISQVSADKWMPGDLQLNVKDYVKDPVDLPDGQVYTLKDRIDLPGEMKSGRYNLSVALAGNDNKNIIPLVQLGIKGRMEDGWYPLSVINVSRN